MAGPWRTATVVAAAPETARARTLRLDLGEPVRHVAGQYYIVRLTAPDGYTAQRSYSAATPADGSTHLELTIERLEGGEVSEFLCDVVEPGDELEVRGPVGGWFMWSGADPVLGVAGGSGVVPLMAMLRESRRIGHPDRLKLLVSARGPGDLFYADEIAGPQTTVLFTRDVPPGVTRPPGRVGAADLAPLVRPGETVFVCGSPGFCDAVTDLLLELGARVDDIRVERFGPSG